MREQQSKQAETTGRTQCLKAEAIFTARQPWAAAPGGQGNLSDTLIMWDALLKGVIHQAIGSAVTIIVFAQVSIPVTPASSGTQVAGADRSSAMTEGYMNIGKALKLIPPFRFSFHKKCQYGIHGN
jgi:hypothetical protein